MWFEATKAKAKNEIPSSKFMNGRKGERSIKDHVLTLVFIF